MTPLYAQVKTHIMDQIRSGALKAGSRVASENELVESFKISRMTANRALNELTSEGHLARVPGVGTFVKEATPRSSLLELRNIADEIIARGHRYSSRIEDLREVTATPALMEDFELKSATPLFHIVVVHEENGMPVQLEDRYVNPFCAPNFLRQDFSATTPTAYLLAAIPVDELEHNVEAILPDANQQRHLHISSNEPCLSLHRRSWSKSHVVTSATLIYPASRYALHSRYHTNSKGSIRQ
jgi:GntR family transcriptional regulator, histidine utilization repressor